MLSKTVNIGLPLKLGKEDYTLKNISFPVLFAYLVIFVVWGSTYFFIKIAVQSIPPLHLVGWRFMISGLLLLSFSFFTGRIRRMPTLRELAASAILGVLLLAGGNGLVSLAEKKVDSYVAALILAATPLFVAVFDRVLLRKHLSVLAWIGILFGVSGVGFLMYPGNKLNVGFSPSMVLVVCALVSWSLATSLGHRIRVYPDSFVNSGIQMLVVGIGMSLIGFGLHPVTLTMISGFTLPSLLSFLYLAIIGCSGFVAYTYLVQVEPAIRVVSYTFVNPIIAILLGMLIGKEKATPFLGFAIPTILIGLFLMVYGNTLMGRLQPSRFKAGSVTDAIVPDDTEVG
jgi:drug/metabolite transporter (DMT)-like permease